MKIFFFILISSLTLFGGFLDNIYQKFFDETLVSCDSVKNIPFENNWETFVEKTDDAISKFEQIDKTEDSWIPFLTTKVDIKEDFNEILETIIISLTEDKKVISCLSEIKNITNKIENHKKSILTITEKHISGLDSESQEKINNLNKDIDDLKNKIAKIKLAILQELKKLGLELSDKELEALLIRVDSNDIIQMMLVFDISKKITIKLSELLKINQENISISKRYYGMNLILSEIALLIQDKYIHKIDSKYIPKLNSIIMEIGSLKQETKTLLENSSNSYEKNIYSTNLKAQDLTIKTAKLYIQNLVQQKQQIEIAKKSSIKNLNLTVNSYKTMKISSNLLNLIKLTQKSFSKIINIQFPEIIPFQNSNIEKEYKKLTIELSQ